jgi:death-on-curing family protein
VQGYSLNTKLLKSQNEKILQLTETINLFKSISNPEVHNTNEIDGFLQLLQTYSEALNLLDDYDYKRFSQIESVPGNLKKIDYAEVMKIIGKMKEEIGNSELFGREKDESLQGSIEAIYQTFDGKDLYPTFFEKAANLLYFIVKNHSFVDGNKRIAAAVFLYFLDKNNYFDKHKLDNDLLTTLTLLIAISNPHDKDLLVNIVSVILQRNL